MDHKFRQRIAAEQGIPVEQVLFAICNSQIVWDNCMGGYATMARKDDVVFVTRHGDSPNLSAYFDYGDSIISDYIGVDVRIVDELEAGIQESANLVERKRRQQRIDEMHMNDDIDDIDYDDNDDNGLDAVEEW